jgi:hypothetical protein
MVKAQIIYWRDIPVQVRVKAGRDRASFPLSDRFQRAIHRAAYRGKAITGDAFMDEWQPSAWQEHEGTVEAVGNALVAQLETEFSELNLDLLAKNKGYKT